MTHPRIWFGRLLYFFAAWTLLIKYILPIGWALYRHEPWITYIYFWDAWWVAHLAVGYGLIHQKRGVWYFAFVLAFAEIIIINVKLIFFLRTPIWNFWYTNWLINKSFLLMYFWALLLWLLKIKVKKDL